MNCAIHPDRSGNNLCIKCGNWYCNECIDYINGQPICKRCRYGKQAPINSANLDTITMIQNMVNALAPKRLLALKVIYFVMLTVILGCSIYLTLSYRIFLLYIPTFIYLVGGIIFYFLFIRKKHLRENPNSYLYK
jgi:hypothetical protein